MTTALVVAVVVVVLSIGLGLRILLREISEEEPEQPAPLTRTRVVIPAQSGTEALALRTALEDPQTRAFVLVVGSLLLLVGGSHNRLSPKAREQALRYVAEREAAATKD
jgi:hypothetical protein